jgi:alpha-amylase/alpha-mannosidase (GH57 family)
MKNSYHLLLIKVILVITLLLNSSNSLNLTTAKSDEMNTNFSYDNLNEIVSERPPIYLNIIWHQHQPSYIDPVTNIYEMPWVFMHSMNSYAWMADLHKNNININATINLTPSLLNQIEDYVNEVAYDRRIQTALILEPEMSDENKTIIIRYFFDINPQFVTGRYLYLQEKSNLYPTMAQKIEAFSDGELLDLKVMFFLRWINKEYRDHPINTPNGDVNLAELDAKIDSGDNSTNKFTKANLEYVLNKGLEITQSVVSKHVAAMEQGNLEMITTPFFHPILPLLIDLESSRESPGNQLLPLPVNNTGWIEDAQEQIDRGVQAYIDTYTGASPKGMWPSEQAVSKDVVPLMANAGIDWFVSDRNVLRNSLGGSELSPTQLYRMYSVNQDGVSVAAVFRDTSISDLIGFSYSGIHPETAANDFVSKIKEIYDSLADAPVDDYIVTVALDGENAWEHYSFDVNSDGKLEYTGNMFRNLLYEKINEAQQEGWLRTITPSQYLEKHPINSLPEIDNLASGSWISGELNTWIGEVEENIAWDWLIDARQALLTAIDNNPTGNFTEAWNALYAAQGSDWFWWYGDDQNSGRDELFDWGFKTFVRKIYLAAGYSEEEIFDANSLLFLKKKPVISALFPGKISDYTIDGNVGVNEWNNAYYINDTSVDEGAILGAYFGVNDNATDLLLRIDLTEDPSRVDNDEFITFYINDPRSSTGDIFPLGSERIIENSLGFQLNYAITYYFNDSSINLWTNDGTGWIKASSLNLRSGLNSVLEIEIPLEIFDFTPGDFFLIGIMYHALVDDIVPEDGPLSFQVPFAGADFTIIFEMDDPAGDEYGDYPTAPDFAPGSGLFDILNFKVGYDDEFFYTTFKMAEIRNPWNAPTGFSHPLFQIYIDKDRISGSGNIEPDQNPNVMIHEDFAWEMLIRADGWLTYGLHTNQSQFGGVDSIADLLESTITIRTPLSMVGVPTEDWAYVVLVGSQDFQAFRERFSEASTWKLGGGHDGPYDPNVVDMLVPDEIDQKIILDDYSVTEQRQAKVIGVGPKIIIGIDETPPTVSITSPTPNQQFDFLSDPIDISIVFTATDDNNVELYDIFLENILKIDKAVALDGENTAVITISKSEIVGGTVTIRVNVYDNTNLELANFGTDTVTIKFNFPTTGEAKTSEPEDTNGSFLNFSLLYIPFLLIVIYLKRKYKNLQFNLINKLSNYHN